MSHYTLEILSKYNNIILFKSKNHFNWVNEYYKIINKWWKQISLKTKLLHTKQYIYKKTE